ncbi:efflux RND transporter permease subunit [Sinisalibacter lacisalsi]|uniref:efflux RND transporter permease subunit n=1 Tax=Sinisalibacter lacisalsi TaxID=1526570 RepID=UPI001663CED3|nr:MMPL family transporter [Sinisalibacter lacisalsi]
MNGLVRKLAAALAALHGRLILLWILLAVILVFSLTGIARLRFDDELFRFFDSDIAAFDDFVALSQAFEGDSNDVIVLIEAPDLADPDVAGAVSDFLLDAQFVPGVRAAISPFSLRVGGEDGAVAPLFPYPPLPRAEMAARLDAERADNPSLSRLMSADRRAMIVVLPITEDGEDDLRERRTQVGALEELGDRLAAAAPGVSVALSGYPVLRDNVARALIDDIVMLTGFGILVGFFIAITTFRSLRLALLTLPGPVMAVSVAIGLHGHLGVAINTMTIALPVLVLVLATSDSIHIGFERARQAGRASTRATVRAVRRVAVACIFAAVTTAVAFAALATSRSEILAEMGRMGVIVALASVFTVILTQTTVLATAGRFAWFAPLFDRLSVHPPFSRGLENLPRLALAAPRRIAWAGLAVLAISTLLYSQAGPRYSLMDSLKPDSPIRTVFDRVEAKVAPVSQIQIPVTSTDPEIVAKVRDVVAEVTESPNVQSIADVVGGAEAVESELPAPLARRLVSRDGTQSLVSVPFRYENGQETLALAERIDAAIAAEPGLAEIEVGRATGLPVMSARVAEVVLDEINRSLLIALGGVAVLIFIWLGNLRIALISLVPNMLPVTLIGAWLMLTGKGIEFSNGLALTVAFGVAVDDTLHVLNRLRLNGGIAHFERARVAAALEEVAPALVTTSLVLVLGMGGTLFAENKGVSDFGKIAMAVYLLALIADLIILPAVLAVFGPRRKHGKLEKEPS